MNFVSKLTKGISVGLVSLSLMLVSTPTAYASNPQPARCSTNAPSSWSWNTTRTYTRSQPWCLHFTPEASYLVWQADGNFVWYANGAVKASSDTWSNANGHGSRGIGVTLMAQTDGNIVVKDSTGHTLWGLNYLNRGYYWKASRAGDNYTISVSQAFINSQTHYPTIDWYRSGSDGDYSATIATG